MNQTREVILEGIRGLVHGPFNGENEILPLSPFDLYTTGILYPQVEDGHGNYSDTERPEDEQIANSEVPDFDFSDEREQLKSRRTSDSFDSEDGELLLTTQFRPSSIGLSAVVSCPSLLSATVSFGLYNESKSDKWKREDFHEKITDFYLNKQIKFTRSSKSIKCSINISAGGKVGITLSDGNTDNMKAEGNNIIYSDRVSDRTIRMAFFLRNYSVSGENSGCKILTASIINESLVDSFHKQKNVKKSVFQPKLLLEGDFMPYEDAADLDKYEDKEELSLKLLYRKYKRYALGHGVAANWTLNETGICNMVETSFIPEQKVNGMDFEPEAYKDSDVLYMKKLAGKEFSDDGFNKENLKIALEEFISAYELWIKGQEKVLKLEYKKGNLHEKLYDQAYNNIKMCQKLLSRMERGISILISNKEALTAFFDANRAMFMQRVMGSFAKERSRKGVLPGDQDIALPDFKNIEFNDNLYTARWRPFQLAFLLSQIEGAVDGTSEDRDTVDLIWFPTGGGKTEAYLGLTAFTIFYRRLKAKKETGSADNGAGVSVLMRYTLRLLNKQQFSRATILIMACDLIRREKPVEYGNKRISIGIWVGKSLTPNKTADNNTALNNYIANINNGANNRIDYPPIFPSCPCCGTKISRIREGQKVSGTWGYFRPSNVPARHPYVIACTNKLCNYHTDLASFDVEKTFPAYYVDDEVYEQQPSLVFATVDKFAQIAWKTETMKLFNLRHGANGLVNEFPSPNLIIQDELHLISSSLGTIYGVFEIAIDRFASKGGGKPKIVAATATVKNAETQCSRLYARKNFMQFPPPALDADDSFFAKKKEKDENARLYIGYMPSGVTTSTANIRLTSAIYEITQSLDVPNSELAKYYTLLVYFNALKELGKYRTFLEDDIVAYRKLLSSFMGNTFMPFISSRVGELSSALSPEEIASHLDRLENEKLPEAKSGIPAEELEKLKLLHKYGIRTAADFKRAFVPSYSRLYDELKVTPPEKDSLQSVANMLPDNSEDPFRIVPATNMVAVGVDIDLLNIMIINGQPKSASEYIQASSRVGRRYPGLVVGFFAPTKNRDRSHYEDFKYFHESYYQFVETTSVTPFSKPALEKALPTVLISLIWNELLNGVGQVKLGAELESKIYSLLGEFEFRLDIIEPESKLLIEMVKEVMDDVCHKLKELTDDYPKNFSNFVDFMDLFGKNPLEQVLPTIVDVAFDKKGLPGTEKHIPKMGTMRNVEPSSEIRISF
jgi:hypothetical protein